MRLPFLTQFVELPFDLFQEHAEKVKECGWAFQQAIECNFSGNCDRFEEYLGEIDRLESEADKKKYEIRTILTKRSRMAVEKHQLFQYIREQDKVLDCVEDCVNWISYRPNMALPDNQRDMVFTLVDAVVTPIEEISHMVVEAKKYFVDHSPKQRRVVQDIITNLHRNEHEADKLEDTLKLTIFTQKSDPISVYHLVELVQRIGSIADHAENTGDIMRAMIEKD